MSYNILGINLSHNSSVCVLKDGKIDFFLEEDRFSRQKYDGVPLESIKYVSKKYFINEISISGLSYLGSQPLNNGFYVSKSNLLTSYISYVDNKTILNGFFLSVLDKYFSYNQNISLTNLFEFHHQCHAASSFFNSGFNKALCIVVDGSGSLIPQANFLTETESIFEASYKEGFKTLYKMFRQYDNKTPPSIGQCYRLISKLLGFPSLGGPGKVMGLSSYGKYNSKIPKILINYKGNPKIFKPNRIDYIDTISDLFKVTNFSKYKEDTAFHLQKDSEEEIIKLIKLALSKSSIKNICCSGGYFLNCVANYRLKKEFPNINFYFDPTANDSGISIGAAKLAWYNKTKDKTIVSPKTLYHGPKYSKEELLKEIKKYLD